MNLLKSGNKYLLDSVYNYFVSENTMYQNTTTILFADDFLCIGVCGCVLVCAVCVVSAVCVVCAVVCWYVRFVW